MPKITSRTITHEQYITLSNFIARYDLPTNGKPNAHKTYFGQTPYYSPLHSNLELVVNSREKITISHSNTFSTLAIYLALVDISLTILNLSEHLSDKPHEKSAAQNFYLEILSRYAQFHSPRSIPIKEILDYAPIVQNKTGISPPDNFYNDLFSYLNTCEDYSRFEDRARLLKFMQENEFKPNEALVQECYTQAAECEKSMALPRYSKILSLTGIQPTSKKLITKLCLS